MSESDAGQHEARDDHDELSAERQSILEHFQEVTGFNDQASCRSLLEAADWSLETAITQCLHLPPHEMPVSAHNSTTSDAPVARIQPAQMVTAGGDGGVFSWLYNILYWSCSYLVSSLADVWRLCWSIVRGPPAIEPADDVRQFIEHFESVYGDCHPPLFSGPYRQAIASAKQQLCFLLVYLHSWRSDECDAFCRRVLCTQQLVDFCRAEQLVVWACSVERAEGSRVSRALHETGYPFVAVVGVSGDQRRMCVVGRLQGVSQCGGGSAAALVTRLRRITGDNEAWLVAARADRHQRHLDQQLRQEQDADYLRSLHADQQKEQRRAEQRERELQQQREAERQLQQQQLLAERLTRLKQLLTARIPEEPPVDTVATEVVRVSIKLPCGERIERRVLATQPVSVLYYMVFCDARAPARFQITLNYPRRVLECCPPDMEPIQAASVAGQSVNDLERSVNDLERSVNDLEHSLQNSSQPEVSDPVTTLTDAGLGRSEVLYVTDLDA